MLFSSIPYLYFFFPIMLLLEFSMPRKWRNFILLAASLIFYFYGEPVYVLLLLFSSATDYTIGLLIEKYHGTKKARVALICSLISNLAILGFFKYADFIIGNINALFNTSVPYMYISLPLGISFFTFQTMSYSIDVYRGEIKAERSPTNFAMYVSMFPQLVAGPIVRYSSVAKEIRDRSHSFENFAKGAGRFAIGLGKKVLIANALGELSVTMLAPSSPTVLSHWLTILAYTLQIYFDFSGYSDMAIGLGRIFGFTFPENFNYPFIAKSISDFWRRWHMSMGTWFREYLYIPLGGNRVSSLKWVRNIFIVWFCTGLWHGANWNFIIWGLYFGVLLALEKLFLGKLITKLPKALQHTYTLFFVFISFAIFYIESGTVDLFKHLGAMVGAAGLDLADIESLYYLRSYAPLLLIACIGATPLVKNLALRAQKFKIADKLGLVLEPAVYAVLLIVSTGYLIDATFNPFLYFRF